MQKNSGYIDPKSSIIKEAYLVKDIRDIVIKPRKISI